MSKSTHATHSPRIAIIILNWNGKEDTLECLATVSQLDYTNYEVVVVDNGSTDDSVHAISKQYPDIILLQTGANLGYAGGNNVGIRRALERRVDFIFLLNNDTTVAPDFLTKLTQAAAEYPNGGMLSPIIYFQDTPTRIWYAGAKWLGTRFEHLAHGEFYEANEGALTPFLTDYASGCAMLVRREVIEQIGLMEPKFFLYFEESDWAYRARKAGFFSYVVPTSKIWHKVSASVDKSGKPLQAYFMTRNRLLWAERNVSLKAYFETIAVTWREFMPRLVFISNKAHEHSPLKNGYWSLSTYFQGIRKNIADPIIRAKMIGFRDYLLHRFGDCPPTLRRELSRDNLNAK